jgi:ribosomal-protein-alanine N-acetyltransferase
MMFRSERLEVRPMTIHEATPTYASWLNDKEVNRYLATKGSTVEELRHYITKKSAQTDCEFYGIFLHPEGRHIGTIKLEPIERVQGYAQIGILIGDKQEWGKGYGSEAMRLIIDYCFKTLRLGEVKLGVIGENEAALQLYKKLGFVEVARKPQSVHYPNGVFDQVEMSLKNHA